MRPLNNELHKKSRCAPECTGKVLERGSRIQLRFPKGVTRPGEHTEPPALRRTRDVAVADERPADGWVGRWVGHRSETLLNGDVT